MMSKLSLFAVLAITIIAGSAGCIHTDRTDIARGSSRISTNRIRLIETRVREEMNSGRVGAASICIMHRGTIVLNASFGHRRPGGPAVDNATPFIIASITKTVTATAVMRLVERGLVCLDDPVKRYIPEFTGGDRDKVTVRMLLTHTSGLPDMLPENTELRRHLQPLSVFFEHIMTTPLLYTPGTDVRYQSMGIVLASFIVERVTGRRFRDFVKDDIFIPLGMTDTFLGLGGRTLDDVVMCDNPPAYAVTDTTARWDGNSIYWREMGNPWGGLHSTTRDIAVFYQTFLANGGRDGKTWMSPATVTAMTRDWNSGLLLSWGLGFALGSQRGMRWFGDLTSDRTFGHIGSSGTEVWADPDRDLVFVFFTTRSSGIPEHWRFMKTISNMAAACVDAR